jgi:hypothetical protein
MNTGHARQSWGIYYKTLCHAALTVYQIRPSLIFVVQVVAYASYVILTMNKKARVFVFETFFEVYIMFKC